jgi:hypothetical protein
VRCHDHVLAVSTKHVERLLLPEEISRVELVAEPGDGKGDKARRAVALVNGRYYAAWDLGQMLEMPALSNAWMLLKLPRGDSEVPLALRTGACLAVHPVRKSVPLPPGLFKARRGAFSSAFDGVQVGTSAPSLVGLCLEPDSLWTTAELEASLAAIALASSRPTPPSGDAGRAKRGEVVKHG